MGIAASALRCALGQRLNCHIFINGSTKAGEVPACLICWDNKFDALVMRCGHQIHPVILSERRQPALGIGARFELIPVHHLPHCNLTAFVPV